LYQQRKAELRAGVKLPSNLRAKGSTFLEIATEAENWYIMPSFDSRQLATFLDISDSRTLCSILDKAGFERHAAFFRHTSVASFLDQQQFIARENTGLEVIRAMFCSTLSVADGD
jgi:hypothetical protein